LKKFSLSNKERIKSKKLFDLIYSEGKIIFSTDRYIKANYLTEEITGKSFVKMAAAVSSKAGKAVWRNRVKRLIRESYRMNKIKLVDLCKEKKLSLYVVFSPVSLNEKMNGKIILNNILPGVVEVINKILKSL
jgi:ribonuclease P protein component